jgi:hypothetical protein
MLPKSRKTLSRLRADPVHLAFAWRVSFVGALAAPHSPRHGYPPGQERKPRVGRGGDGQRVADDRINSSPE